jgi:hypothetical protein
MSGTSEGNRKIRDKLLAQDLEYFKKLGSKGGTAIHTAPRGYASDKIGNDGLSGKQRAQKLGSERKK